MRFIAALILAAAGLSAPAADQTPAANSDASALPGILKAAGDYCEVVKGMALNFVCLERIREQENFFTRGTGSSRNSPDAIKRAKSKTRTFAYDYQIVKSKDDVRESRMLLEEDGRKRHEENAELPTLKFSGRNLVYGPVGFLSRYWQSYFTYEIVGREEIGGRKAIVIRAAPKTEREENNNRGRVWVDASSHQILRLEMEPPNTGPADVVVGNDSAAVGADFRRQLTWTIDYGIEKKGVLFPSRQTIRETYVSDTGFSVVKREVVFDYSDYRYFTVEVEIK
jgi:hypothetical protein